MKKKKGSIKVLMIVVLVILGIIALIIWLLLIINGIYICLDNDALGILLLFITLNIIGIIIAIALLYNTKNKIKDKKEKEWRQWIEKNFKKESINDL